MRRAIIAMRDHPNESNRLSAKRALHAMQDESLQPSHNIPDHELDGMLEDAKAFKKVIDLRKKYRKLLFKAKHNYPTLLEVSKALDKIEAGETVRGASMVVSQVIFGFLLDFNDQEMGIRCCSVNPDTPWIEPQVDSVSDLIKSTRITMKEIKKATEA